MKYRILQPFCNPFQLREGNIIPWLSCSIFHALRCRTKGGLLELKHSYAGPSVLKIDSLFEVQPALIKKAKATCK